MDIYTSFEERKPSPLLTDVDKYWVVDAGYKNDFTLKNWGYHRYCEVVDALKDTVKFVQIGEANKDHIHKPVPGAVNLIGRTDIRQLIQIIYNSRGVLTPVSFPMHLAAALPTQDSRLRPCIVIAGGREPVTWEQYPGHQFLHTVGMLHCCCRGGCWKSRGKRLGDGTPSDFSICAYPVMEEDDAIGKCMTMIEPEHVIKLIKMYEENKR